MSGVERMAADLSGARVLVVGSSTGIGRRIAIEAVGAGASVVFSARSRDKLESAVAEAGGGVVVVGDVRKPDDCTRIVDETVAAIGGLDLVVFADRRLAADAHGGDAGGDDARRVRDERDRRADAPHRGRGAGSPRAGSSPTSAPTASAPPTRGWCTTRRRRPRSTRGSTVCAWSSRRPGSCASPSARPRAPPSRSTTTPRSRRGCSRRCCGSRAGTEKFMTATDLGELIVELLAPALRHRDIEVEDIVIRPPGGPGAVGHRPRRCRPRRTRRSPSPRAPARSGWTSSTPPRTGPSPTRCASG